MAMRESDALTWRQSWPESARSARARAMPAGLGRNTGEAQPRLDAICQKPMIARPAIQPQARFRWMTKPPPRKRIGSGMGAGDVGLAVGGTRFLLDQPPEARTQGGEAGAVALG